MIKETGQPCLESTIPHLFILLLDLCLVDFLQVGQQGVRELHIALVQQGAKVNCTPNISQLQQQEKDSV